MAAPVVDMRFRCLGATCLLADSKIDASGTKQGAGSLTKKCASCSVCSVHFQFAVFLHVQYMVRGITTFLFSCF